MMTNQSKTSQPVSTPTTATIDFVDGNFEDKYNARNPISKHLVNGFLTSFKTLLPRLAPDEAQSASATHSRRRIIEIGAGEGFLTKLIAESFSDYDVIACDLSERVNALARELLKNNKNVSVKLENAENVHESDSSMTAIICCEVLEHVENPQKAISEIYRMLLPGGRAIVSVPREPIWRVLNLIRIKYIKDLGNTPGHLNHWSNSSFKEFVRLAGFTVIEDFSPFPWTMLLIEKPVTLGIKSK